MKPNPTNTNSNQNMNQLHKQTLQLAKLNMELNQYKRFIEAHNGEELITTLHPNHSLPENSKQLIDDIEIIGAGSEGKVIQLNQNNSKSLCLKVYEVEQERRKVDLCERLEPSPYLVKTYHHNQDYRLMEYVEGEELTNYLRDHVSITISLTDQLKGLLDYVISQALRGIYINDISVYNIIIDKQGKPVIVDYDNIEDQYFQFPSFLNHSGMAHLARYFYQTIEDLNLNKNHLIFSDLDYDKFDYDVPNGSWYEEYRQMYSKYEYGIQQPKLNEFYQLDSF